MQPDLLSAPQEEIHPELLAVEDMLQPEALPQTEPLPVAGPTPPAIEKKRFKVNWAAIGLGFAMFLLLAVLGWVGYWAYTLNTELNATRQQLSTLQAKHDKLQSDYTALTSEKEKLNTDLTQSKEDLEKTSDDLATAQSDLSKSAQEKETLNDKIFKATQYAEILHVWVTTDNAMDIFTIDSMIKKTKDQQLMDKWEHLLDSRSEDEFGAFVELLIKRIQDNLD